MKANKATTNAAPTQPAIEAKRPHTAFQIDVKTLSGKPFTVSVMPTELVGTVMNQIEEKLQIPVLNQKLFFAGKLLEATKKIGDYGINKDSCLSLAVAQAHFKAYEDLERAYNLARKDLSSTSPKRLQLALDFAKAAMDQRKDKQQAMKVAKSAFDEAICDLDKLTNENYMKSTSIMQKMRDYLTAWSQAPAPSKPSSDQTPSTQKE